MSAVEGFFHLAWMIGGLSAVCAVGALLADGIEWYLNRGKGE